MNLVWNQYLYLYQQSSSFDLHVDETVILWKIIFSFLAVLNVFAYREHLNNCLDLWIDNKAVY